MYEGGTVYLKPDRGDSQRGGCPVAGGCVTRKHGISSASYYNWKAKYGGLDASELERTKKLEGQLAEFKQIIADLTLDLMPNYLSLPRSLFDCFFR